jgi:thioredoxin 1
MKNIISHTLLLLLALFFMTTPAWAGSNAGQIPVVPAPGRVTMVELGADSCIPCKLMKPIIAEVKADYRNRAAILFVDVWKHPEVGKKFQIGAIPTQIFFDHTGKEISRHRGFYPKKNIVRILDSLLEKQEIK